MEYIDDCDPGHFIKDHGWEAKAGARDIASQILEDSWYWTSAGLAIVIYSRACH